MEVKLKIPEKWNEITLTQFQSYYAEMRKDINETTKLLILVSSFCGISISQAHKIYLKDLKKTVNSLNILFTKIPKDLILMFRWEGKEYGFIPNFDELTVGEYADLEYYLSDKDLIWDNMHTVMSILYREVIDKQDDKYRIKDYEPTPEVAKSFRTLPMNIVYGASNFFLTLGMELSEIMSNFTQEEMETIIQNDREKQKQTNGDGTH